MPGTVAEQLIETHLAEGTPEPGEEIGLTIDQTLTQDATGTMVMLELEAMGLDRVATELSAQYVDHNMIQEDSKNPDDHLFLQSACHRFGVWFSGPGNGVSHPVHQERFGVPTKTLLGSDSHTPAAGAIGMLAMGAGGIDVAMAMTGQPYSVKMPEIWGIELTGELPDWVSAKDVILEMLRRHDVDGGVGRILEYHGSGLDNLSCMDRHVIANMGTELGATSTVFPSDGEVRSFLARQGREEDWQELVAEPDATYDVEETIDLSELEPLIATPSSPGNVVPVEEIAGEPLYQAYLGSSANPGYRDFALPAAMVEDRVTAPGVSFDVNPTSRQILQNLTMDGHLANLIAAGARIHQAGCNGCIGMGQAPATGSNSLRTVPRNFPGRSGTTEDRVFLCSPETATASALEGEITDPRTLEMPYPRIREPEEIHIFTGLLQPPLPVEQAQATELTRGPNIHALPTFDPLPETLDLPVLLHVGDDVSTDEILPAGSRVLPYRSNVPRISEFCFDILDETYHDRALEVREQGGHAVVGGANYGQGSSREHAALAPRYLGLRLVIAKSFGRIHENNLVNFGILPLHFQDPADHEAIRQGDTLHVEVSLEHLEPGGTVTVTDQDTGETVEATHQLSQRQIEVLRAGGLINQHRQRSQSDGR